MSRRERPSLLEDVPFGSPGASNEVDMTDEELVASVGHARGNHRPAERAAHSRIQAHLRPLTSAPPSKSASADATKLGRCITAVASL